MPTRKLQSVLFKATGGGWVFRSPNPWIFADTPHYLVDDAQKAKKFLENVSWYVEQQQAASANEVAK